MSRILNLNDFSAKALAFIGLLGLVFPAGLWGLELLLQTWQVNWPWLAALRWILFSLGALLLAAFLLLVILEQIQDHWLFKRYLSSRRKRLTRPGRLGECPYCGNRQLQDFQQTCPICGHLLE